MTVSSFAVSLTILITSATQGGMTMSVAEVIKIVKDTAKDETVMKYLTRFRQKLKQPLQVE